MTDCATKRVWLAEAELALHQLSTGSKEVTVTFGSGKSVTYSQARISDLTAYVSNLRDQVAACDGTTRNRRAPIRFSF